MASNMRPFWEILVVVAEHGAQVPLSCNECFAILEFLAEAAMQGVEERYLFDAARRHLGPCPECQEHHLQRLNELEAALGTRENGR